MGNNNSSDNTQDNKQINKRTKVNETATIAIPIEQTFLTTDYMLSRKDTTFKYVLIPLEEENAMPENSENGKYIMSLIGNETDNQIVIPFDYIGTSTYIVKQLIEEEKEHFIYDTQQYYITVKTNYNSNNKFVADTIVKNDAGLLVSIIDFCNEYNDDVTDK